MQPLTHQTTLAALDVAASLAQGDGTRKRRVHAGLLFLQEDASPQGQKPETHDGGGTHQLRVIQAEFLVAIAKEDVHIPACRAMGEQGLWVGFPIAGGPKPCLCQRSGKLPTPDDDLAAGERANRGAR